MGIDVDGIWDVDRNIYYLVIHAQVQKREIKIGLTDYNYSNPWMKLEHYF